MTNNKFVVVRNIKIPCTFEDACVLDRRAVDSARKIFKKSRLGNSVDLNNCFVYKKSIDARNKNEILIIYSVAAIFYGKQEKLPGLDVVYQTVPEFVNYNKITQSPVVVGFGPSGMFASLALARAGLKPIVIERGCDVDTRATLVEKYWKTSQLDENTNVQFGEGGAGTFSDGKLLTRINDSLTNFVLQEFVNHGAPSEIKYIAKPHIGTDLLRKIVRSIRNEIIALGGNIIFNKRFEKVCFDSNNNPKCVITSDGDEFVCSAVFLCIGHSARDTVKNLLKSNLEINPKSFSVGMRIEHLQEDIDNSMYGKFVSSPSLGHAQYTLSARFNNRAVYSFCMCPGGVVVASASENGQIVTNGMSYYARDGVNANSAIAVSVNHADFGSTVEGAIEFQRNIEQTAFRKAGNNASAPIQLCSDFFEDRLSKEASRILPSYTGKTSYVKASEIFPGFVTNNIKLGLKQFEREIKGFCCEDALLTFPETRTSSPVRIERNINFESTRFSNIYPCGEGAGYAGGITSAAVDGIRAALAFMNKTLEV